MSTAFYFPSRASQRWLHVGPLAGELDRFATRLEAQGYARPTAVSKLRSVSNLSRWLEHQALGVEALDEPRIEAFLLTRGPRCGQRGEATTARQLLSHLRASGRIPLAPLPPHSSNPLVPIEPRIEGTVWGRARRVRFPLRVEGLATTWRYPAGELRSAPARWE